MFNCSVDRLSMVINSPCLMGMGLGVLRGTIINIDRFQQHFLDLLADFRMATESYDINGLGYEVSFITKGKLTVKLFPTQKIRSLDEVFDKDYTWHAFPDLSAKEEAAMNEDIKKQYYAERAEYMDYVSTAPKTSPDLELREDSKYIRKTNPNAINIDFNPNRPEAWDDLKRFISLTKFFLPNLSLSDFRINRIDLALDIVGDSINPRLFVSKSKNERVYLSDKGVETYYMGSVSSSKQWRIYNKAIEHRKKYKKEERAGIESFEVSDDFSWWRIESQFRPKGKLFLDGDFLDLWDDLEYSSGDYSYGGDFPSSTVAIARACALSALPFKSALKELLPGAEHKQLRKRVLKVFKAHPDLEFNPVELYRDLVGDALGLVIQMFNDMISDDSWDLLYDDWLRNFAPLDSIGKKVLDNEELQKELLEVWG